MGILISLALVLVATIIIVVIRERHFFDFAEGILFGFMYSLGTVFFTFIILLAISTIPNSKEVLSNTIEITALQDNSNVKGSFFLGTGTVDEEQYYYYIKETNRGKTVEKISAENSYLNEGNYEPNIKVYTHEYTNKFARWYFGEEAWGETIYEIYIPEGSVTTEFNVDLE